MPKHLIATGINGLVGSKFKELYTKSYTIQSLDIADKHNPVDITNKNQVLSALANTAAECVIHLAAYTDVTAAWKQRNDKSGSAYKVNVEGTRNIVHACKQSNLHLIHISTAYVFDGKKDGLYNEDDQVNPIEWYGYTKAEAETVIRESDVSHTILRIDQPFRSDRHTRPDIAHRIIDGLTSGELYPQFTNHFFGPTFIDDFSKVLDWVARTKPEGVFNASSGELWSDYDFAQAIAQTHSFSPNLVKKGNLDEYLQSLDRPYQKNTAMDTSKLQSNIDFKLTDIIDALSLVR